MNIERQRVLEQFAEYTRKYNANDPKIALKIAHTYRVASNCEVIANSIGLGKEDTEISWLSGMLHDIGRFEQVKRYNTFIDSESVDHAEFGADLLFGKERLIEAYVDDRSYDDILEVVIRQHNKFRINKEITGKTLDLCNILRDADKIDILRVNVETPMEEIYNVSEEELKESAVSDAVVEQMLEHHAICRDVCVTPADHLIGHISLNYELVFQKSWELVNEQGYINKMFEFQSRNDETKKVLKLAKSELEDFYNK